MILHNTGCCGLLHFSRFETANKDLGPDLYEGRLVGLGLAARDALFLRGEVVDVALDGARAEVLAARLLRVVKVPEGGMQLTRSVTSQSG